MRKKKINDNREVFGKSVKMLKLSFRASNCLEFAKIDTIEKLLAKNKSDLMGYRNFGKKTLKEITEKLARHGLAFGGRLNIAKLGPEGSFDQGNPNVVELLEFPELQIKNDLMNRISKTNNALSVDNLHLDSRAALAVFNLGVRDIGGFVALLAKGINANNLRNFGKTAFSEIKAAADSLQRSANPDGSWDAISYAKHRGFRVIPENNVPSVSEIMNHLESWVKIAVEAQFQGKASIRYLDILNGRIRPLTDGGETLAVLGDKFGLSRERIRQNETQIERYLKPSLLEGRYSISRIKRSGPLCFEGLKFRFHPLILETIQKLNKDVHELKTSIFLFDEWKSTLAKLLNTSPEQIDKNSGILSFLLGYYFETLNLRNSINVKLVINDSTDREQVQRLKILINDIHLFVQTCDEALSADQIFRALGSEPLSKKVCLNEAQILALIPTMELAGQGVWRIKKQYFNPNLGKLTCSRAYEILKENGSRMHSSQILRIFKLEHPDFLESDRLLACRLLRDKRFRPISKSGYWVLSEWNQETGTIRESLLKLLEKADRPMHIDEILQEIRRARPCSISSVLCFLADSPDKFVKLSSRTYGLASKYPQRLRHSEF